MRRLTGRGALTLLALAGTALAACTTHTERDDEAPRLSSFDVKLERPEFAGTPEEPRPFPSAQIAETVILVRALDQYGQLYKGDDAWARISVEPGELTVDDRVGLIDGERRVEVRYRFSYNETRIWIEDVGEDPITDCKDGLDNDNDLATDLLDPDCLGSQPDPTAHAATQAVGISPPLYFARPRIRDIQFSPRCTTDTPLSGQNITIESGTLMVTGTTQSGMYVTDLTGPEGGYNSIYLFTFSNPGDVRRGDRLCGLAGNAAEFIANSQLSFPSFVNADTSRNGTIDELDRVPCDLSEPERIGPDAVPPPVVLTPEHFADNVEGLDPPPDFYRFCGPNGSEIQGLVDATDCQAARNRLPADFRRSGPIDCARDNFAIEPFEHALVAIEGVVISNRFERCDLNGDGRIDRTNGSPEDGCEEGCTEDPLCTELLSLEGFGQFAVGLGCEGTGEDIVCKAKAFVSTRDTLGGTGYSAQDNAGAAYDRVVGHLRQLQPGAGVPSSWIIEPRIIEDFVSPSGGNP